MYKITKIFTIKNNLVTTDTVLLFFDTFYEKLIENEHIITSVSPENFRTIFEQIKSDFINSNKIINQKITVEDNKVFWQVIFESEQAYTDYRNLLMLNFNTDFHFNIDSDQLSLEIII